MKVDIEHEEATTGLVFKKAIHKIHCTVIFSEEEKYTIKKQRLNDMMIMERPPFPGKKVDPMVDFLFVRTLLKGKDTFATDTTIAANRYESELMTHLQELKTLITEGTHIAEKTKSFEL